MMIIPLDNGAVNAHQLFQVQLGENLVDFRLNYLQSSQWAMDLSIQGELIAASIMLEPNADLLVTYNLSYLDGRMIFVGAETTLDNLGSNNSLHWLPNE